MEGTIGSRELEDALHQHHGSPVPSSRDIYIRLAYVEVIDSTLNVLRLRFFCELGPYCVRGSSSEGLTIFLAIYSCVYT